MAERLLDHPQPFFAPIAAIVTLGVTYGQRMRRGIEIAVGVAVGVLIGELFAVLAGSGVWQIIVVLVLAMSVATLLSTPAADHHPGLRPVASSWSRWRRQRRRASAAGSMRWSAARSPCWWRPWRRAHRCASRPGWPPGCWTTWPRRWTPPRPSCATSDEEAGDAVLAQARQTDDALAELNDATAEGLAVVRQSPFRRRQLAGVRGVRPAVDPLDHASRNLRVLARRCAVALWRGEEVPAPYRAADGWRWPR